MKDEELEEFIGLAQKVFMSFNLHVNHLWS